ncbi:MAG: DUF4406 domain-containing protein [Anaerocolumna sp.]
MKIYIAGPITGHMNYRKHFAAAERCLRRKGHIIINPSFLPDGLKDYMDICYSMIDQADAVYMLTGYENSVGAKEELIYARLKQKKIFFQEEVKKETKRVAG